MVPKTDWIRWNERDWYWDTESQSAADHQQTFKASLGTAMKCFSHTQGVHTLQETYGCEWDSEHCLQGGFDEYGYDGRDFIVFDSRTGAWVSPVPQALPTKMKWDDNRDLNEGLKLYLTQECVTWLKKYLRYGTLRLERKVPPKVFVLQKGSKHTGWAELSCLATGFFPRDVVLSWQRDGQELHEGVESGELLPNGDGTYQVRKSLRVSSEDLEGHTYSCHAYHPSLGEKMPFI
ncbi:HA1F protein, partial [Amia calva]|nr:HA1F protein [Amia calva]